MSLLTDASLLLTPNAYKEGKLYSVIPSNGNGDFTVTRATTATRVNSAGLVDLVPYNLLQQSEMFSQAIWTKSATTLTANTTTAPDGTLTADTLIENTANSSHQVFQSVTSVNGATAYTATIYVKQNTNRNVALRVQDGAFTYGQAIVTYNLNTGTLISQTVSGNGVIVSTSATLVNGYYRIQLTFTINLSTSFRMDILMVNGSLNSYLGDGTSSIIIWGAQIVEGTSARDYLRTETRLNIPRIDYSLGGCPNILLEPQRTNLILQSSSFDNASWGKAASSVTANSTTSPSGIQDADTFTGDGTNTLHQVVQTVTVTNALAYTVSIYAKKNTNNFLQIYAANANFGANAWVNFDLNNGVVGSVGSSATVRIENVGNGWYRCIMTATATATAAGNIAFHLINSATSVRGETNTLSTSVFLWGAQLEQGAYATSFIPTTTASVTRNFDYIIRNNLVTNGIVSATQGTWFVEIRNNLLFTRDNSTSSLNFGMDGNNCIRFRHSGSGRISIEKNVGGVLTTLVSGLSTTQTMKIAFKWNGSEVETFMNGVQQTPANKTYPSTIIPQTVTTNFTNTNFGVPMTINEMAFFPNQLTDSQLIALTT